MAAPVLSTRALNRALLARQGLLEPWDGGPLEIVHWLAGLQAQAPLAPYYGVFARSPDFDPRVLATALVDRTVVRLSLMRSTLQLVTAGDALAFRAVLALTHHGYEVTTASAGRPALKLAAATRPDVVLLDLGLPDLDGLEVIPKLLAQDPETAVIVLSARTGSSDKVVALDIGAVDYVTKPFDINELVARLRAVVRRRLQRGRDRTLVLEAVTIDVSAGEITRNDDGSSIHLTPTEWRLVLALTERAGALVTPSELLTAARGTPAHTDSSYLRIYLAQLRRKLEREPSRPKHFLTVPGIGYRFQPIEGTGVDS